MKHVSICWLKQMTLHCKLIASKNIAIHAYHRMLRGPIRIAAACLCFAAPVLAQNPADLSETEGAVSLSGRNAVTTSPYFQEESSGSVVGQPVNPVQQVQDVWSPSELVDDAPPFIEETFSRDPGVGFASMQDLDRILYRAGVHTHDRYGIEDGYTTIDAFIPISISGDKSLYWFNPRVNITDDADGTLNLGFGRRFYVPEEDRVYGSSFWWDHDSGHRGTYNALGGSFESLGRYFSMRGNFALPIGSDSTRVSTAPTGNPRFQGSSIVLDQLSIVERAYKNFDLEVTTPFPLLGDYGVDLGLGVYYAGASGVSDVTGFSLRTQAQITEDVYISGLLTEDSTWDTNFSINVEVTMPQGTPQRWFRRKPVSDMLTASVLRKYRIPTARSQTISARPLLNKNGTAIQVAHINPNAVATGTGGVTTPFMSLADYASVDEASRRAVDIIFVNGRDDITDTNLNTGIVLFDNQALLGSGVLADGSIPMFQTSTGLQQLPTTPAGALPLLSNSGAAAGTNVITLANSNQVAGFSINASGTSNGIFGANIDGFNIHNNTFNNVVNAINITSNTRPANAGCFENIGIINNNTINGTSGLNGDGISLTHLDGELSLQVTNNVVNNVAGAGGSPPKAGTGAPPPPPPGTLGGVGIDILATGGTINANNVTGGAFIGNNTTTNNAIGMRIIARSGAVINADVQSNTATGNTDPDSGIEIIADAATLNLETFSSNVTTNNSGTGTLFRAINTGLLNANSPPESVTNAMTGITTTVDGPAVTMNSFDNNGTDGLRIESDTNSRVLVDQFSGNTFTGNGDDGLDISIANGSRVDIIAAMTDNVFTNNDGDGFVVTTGTGSIYTGSFGSPDAATAAIFTGNGDNGLAFNLNGGRVELGTMANLTATGNGANGLSIINNLGGLFNTSGLLNNDFSNNTASGLFIGGTGAGAALNRATTNLGNVTSNNFDRTTSGTMGIEFDSIDVFTTATLRSNSFIGDPVGNTSTGRGIGGRVSGTQGVAPAGGVVLDLVSLTAASANIFTNNVDAHIGLIMEGNTQNDIRIDNHTFANAIDGANINFDGDGVAYILRDTASLTGFLCRTDLTDNAGNGFSAEVSGNNAGMFASIDNFSFGGHGLGNTVTGNGKNGVQLLRTADGEINNFSITNNVISNNGVLNTDGTGLNVNQFEHNGIYLLSANAPKVDTVTIEDNEITNNAGDGVLIDVRADGQINVPIRRNTITGNGSLTNPITLNGTNRFNGIHVVEQVTDPSDLRGVTGPWQSNDISNNAGRGILLDGVSGNTDPITFLTTPLVIGDATDTTLGNMITENGLDGIEMNGAGTLVIANNLIARNGTAAPFNPIAVTNAIGNDVAAIDLNTLSVGDVSVLNNDITDNRGDGIEIDGDGSLLTFVINNNIIDFNDGRGLDVLSQPSTNAFATFTSTDITFNNNIVNANLLEGVYIVQTADANQGQSGLQPDSQATDAGFGTAGQVLATPTLIFNSDNNQILANGINAEAPDGSNGLISSTGFVVYVGTSDGGHSFANPGGFASGFGGFGTQSFTGGVQMSITNTNLSGNFGSDLFFRSFTSTNGSGNSGTSWNDMGFNPGNYQGDPLARLDLVYTNNTFNGADVTNVGGFYNNADGVFKSRTFDQMNPADGGPFGSDTRMRNAQRQASRLPAFGNPLPPTNPVFGGATFLYPGLGDSTFRVQGDATELFNAGFIFDTPSPMTDVFDSNGIFRAGGGGPLGVDNMPFGWGTF